MRLPLCGLGCCGRRGDAVDLWLRLCEASAFLSPGQVTKLNEMGFGGLTSTFLAQLKRKLVKFDGLD